MKTLGELKEGDYLYQFDMKRNKHREYKEWPVELWPDLFTDIQCSKIKHIYISKSIDYSDLYAGKGYIRIYRKDCDGNYPYNLSVFGLDDHYGLYNDYIQFYHITNAGTRRFITTSFESAKDLMKRLLRSIERYYIQEHRNNMRLISQYKKDLSKLKEPPHV